MERKRRRKKEEEKKEEKKTSKNVPESSQDNQSKRRALSMCGQSSVQTSHIRPKENITNNPTTKSHIHRTGVAHGRHSLT